MEKATSKIDEVVKNALINANVTVDAEDWLKIEAVLNKNSGSINPLNNINFSTLFSGAENNANSKNKTIVYLLVGAALLIGTVIFSVSYFSSSQEDEVIVKAPVVSPVPDKVEEIRGMDTLHTIADKPPIKDTVKAKQVTEEKLVEKKAELKAVPDKKMETKVAVEKSDKKETKASAEKKLTVNDSSKKSKTKSDKDSAEKKVEKKTSSKKKTEKEEVKVEEEKVATLPKATITFPKRRKIKDTIVSAKPVLQSTTNSESPVATDGSDVVTKEANEKTAPETKEPVKNDSTPVEESKKKKKSKKGKTVVAPEQPKSLKEVEVIQ